MLTVGILGREEPVEPSPPAASALEASEEAGFAGTLTPWPPLAPSPTRTHTRPGEGNLTAPLFSCLWAVAPPLPGEGGAMGEGDGG